jgi:hypothetical protein
MMTINISNPVLESAIKSIAKSHSKNTDDIVQGALAAQFGYQELMHLFAAGQPMSDMETEQLVGCHG